MPDGQLRLYQPGEDIRRIHWKATALQGRPILRNTIPEPKHEIVLLPETRPELPEGEEGWLTEDAVTEGTLMIADYFLRSRITMRVVLDERRSLVMTSPADYDRLYGWCSGQLFTAARRPDELLEEDVTRQGAGSSYILLIWTLDELFLRRVSRCIDLGADVTCIYVGADSGASQLAQAERRMHFHMSTDRTDIYALLAGSGEEGSEA